ncbi:Zinc finger RING-type domain containing protein [Klebsormidium nitens]|uniref:RING-type E3 ubiquitin transferase n=1 Tax=Klebsormidium nitens TaxID=105231 RepID=A0A1Y1IL21_KLENI|nr:Zinc finger RING-type domain containing protein [Klebsormidium nitens]|eukprot:GAQ90862.1 Zinc finger RING-type domain containing protein [Klebsormidium nitens]
MATSVVHWERREDSGWQKYDDAATAAIKAAEGAGQGSVQIVDRGTTCQLVFAQEGPKQVNPITGYRRNARRIVNPIGSNPGQAAVQWEWFDGNNWEAYPPEISVRVEAAREAGEAECDFTTLYGQDFRIEFGVDAWQTINGKQQPVRKVTTTLSPPPSAPAPTPPAGGFLSNIAGMVLRRSARLAGLAPGAQVPGTSANAPPAGPSSPSTSSAKEPEDEDEAPLSAVDFPMDGSVHPSLLRTIKNPDDEDCVVCYESLRDKPAVRLMLCKHEYHLECIKKCFAQKPKCPTCMRAYGVRTGNQPENGTLTVKTYTYEQAKHACVALEGHEGSGVIVINYSFPHGVQGPNHPNPGTHYSGTNRVAYLVDDAQGREVLALLRTAFKRRLTFTVGRSQTTGRDNQVVWSGIHHKTHPYGGAAQHGYPDETYHARVKAELAEFGVTA